MSHGQSNMLHDPLQLDPPDFWHTRPGNSYCHHILYLHPDRQCCNGCWAGRVCSASTKHMLPGVQAPDSMFKTGRSLEYIVVATQILYT